MLNNQKFRDILYQAVLVTVVAVLLVYCIVKIRVTVASQGMVSGFGFLERSTGWDISYSILDYSISDTYARIILIGLLNTLYSGLLGLAGATIIGSVVGLARLSSNFLLRLMGGIYVETFRNIPLILQIIFWYQIIGHMPHPRQAISLFGLVLFSNRGIFWPVLDLAPWAKWACVATVLAGFAVWLARKRIGSILPIPTASRMAGLVVLLCLVWIVAGNAGRPQLFDVPRLAGLNIRGGTMLSPELIALVFGIWLYGGAYIGEIVRTGFLSIKRGQTEAARSLGLRPRHVFSRIQLPLAIRAIMPTLANQYVWLMKATTLGIVIGFSDFFMIISTGINQSGQTLELLAILMVGFLSINLSIGGVMNWINRKLALKGN